MTNNNPSQQERCPTCRGLGMFAGVACPTINYHQSPAEVSQPEGWEKEFDEFMSGHSNFRGGLGSVVIPDLKDFIRTTLAEQEDTLAVKAARVVREARASTLTTLVKEMEGLKKGSDNESDESAANRDGYNAGISAAIEVVNRLMK